MKIDYASFYEGEYYLFFKGILKAKYRPSCSCSPSGSFQSHHCSPDGILHRWLDLARTPDLDVETRIHGSTDCYEVSCPVCGTPQKLYNKQGHRFNEPPAELMLPTTCAAAHEKACVFFGNRDNFVSDSLVRRLMRLSIPTEDIEFERMLKTGKDWELEELKRVSTLLIPIEDVDPSPAGAVLPLDSSC